MANLPFVLFVCAVFLLILLGLFLIDYYFLHDQRQPTLFRALNRNQLLVFLIANLMTGAVNLTINTLGIAVGKTFLILNSYSFIVGVVAEALDFWDVSAKI